jgi:hypothetical protein
MVYKLGQTKRQRVLNRVFRNLRLYGLPALAVLAGLIFAAQDGKLAVLAEFAQGGSSEKGTTSSNVVGNSTIPPKLSEAEKKKRGGKVAGDSVDKLRITECNVTAAKRGLAASSVSQLKKLAEYEDVCNGAIAERASFFVPTPANAAEAKDFGFDVALTLKEFASKGVSPLVIIEPTGTNGPLDAKKYAAGEYNAVLDAYFAEIKTQGINDQSMGMWLWFPEFNTPAWGNVDPNDFSGSVKHSAERQKAAFPGSKASVMLDAQTYNQGDADWLTGKYASLVPYVQNIPKGLIDSFGLQGFPWAPPATEGSAGAVYDAAVFIPSKLAIEAGKALGVKEVWLNTGTFNKQYAKDAAKTVVLSPAQRQTMLNGIIGQADKIKAAGFKPTIHIFAENKSNVTEGIDWSYWTKGQASASPATAVFKTFVHDAAAKGYPLWIYDSNN